MSFFQKSLSNANDFSKYPKLAYNFMTNRIPSVLNILARKKKRCYVYLPIAYIRHSLFRGHQTVAIKAIKVKAIKLKAKYIILCLSDSVISENASVVSHSPALMSNRMTCSHKS